MKAMQNILNQDELNFLLRGQKPGQPETEKKTDGTAPGSAAPRPAEQTQAPKEDRRSWQEFFADVWSYSLADALGVPVSVKPGTSRTSAGSAYAKSFPDGSFLALMALPPFPHSVLLALSARLSGAFLDAGLGGSSPQDCARPLTDLEQVLLLHILRPLPGCLACALAPGSPAPAFLRSGTDAERLWPEMPGLTLDVSSFEIFLEGVSASFDLAFPAEPEDGKSPAPLQNGAA